MVNIWRWLREFWWIIVVGAAGVGSFFFLLFLPKSKRGDLSSSVAPEQKFKDRAMAEVERVRLEGEIERARVTALMDGSREKLKAIEEVGRVDPAEARKQLAAWLCKEL